MVVTRGRQREYGDLSYHHIVLDLGEVDHLHIVTRQSQRSSAHVGSPPPSFFSFLALDAEGTWREEARFASPAARVWPSFCVSLGEMLFDSTFLAMRTSNGVRPGLVSKFLCHILSIMLITFHSPSLSGDPL